MCLFRDLHDRLSLIYLICCEFRECTCACIPRAGEGWRTLPPPSVITILSVCVASDCLVFRCPPSPDKALHISFSGAYLHFALPLPHAPYDSVGWELGGRAGEKLFAQCGSWYQTSKVLFVLGLGTGKPRVPLVIRLLRGKFGLENKRGKIYTNNTNDRYGELPLKRNQ